MTDSIEKKCIANGVKLTDQRKTIARVISESKKTYGEADHPDVDELYKRVSNIDPKISIATVYRTVKLFEESGILMKHDFKDGKARYELNDDHNHLIDIKSGNIIEFTDEEIAAATPIPKVPYANKQIGMPMLPVFGKKNVGNSLK